MNHDKPSVQWSHGIADSFNDRQRRLWVGDIAHSGRPRHATSLVGDGSRQTSAWGTEAFVNYLHTDPRPGLSTAYHYYPNNAPGESSRALMDIIHSGPAGLIARHDYVYDAAGRITSWQKQGSGLAGQTSAYGYTLADELIRSETTLDSDSSLIDREHWSLDAAGNWLAHSRDSGSILETRSHDAMNRLKTIGGSGTTLVEGTVNEFSTVTVNGEGAQLSVDPVEGYRYKRSIPVQPGTNSITVEAKDTQGNETTKTWEFSVPASTTTISYDANGNTLNDGQRIFTWDVKNRLRSVTKEGITWKWDYDHMDRRVREYENGALVKTFIWKGTDVVQERNGNNTIVRTHYSGGFSDGITPSNGTKYQTLADHLGHVREIVDANGAVATRYDYTSYQGPVKVSGTVEATFQTIGRYYHHAGSDLELASFRAYDAILGRWLSEDPIQELGGTNLYEFVQSSVINQYDQLGLMGYNADGSFNWGGLWGDACDVGIDGLGTGVMQTLDGINPFDDPFQRGGWIPPGFDGNVSAEVAGYTNPAALSLKGAKALGVTSKLANSRWFGLGSKLLGRGGKFGDKGIANANDFCRLGWSWKGSFTSGSNVLRMALGKPLKTGPKWLRKLWEKVRHMDILE